MGDFKRRRKLSYVAFPKMMERIGLLPKLWSAERRAEKYAQAAHAAAYFQEWGKAKRHEHAAQHGKSNALGSPAEETQETMS